MKGLSASTSNSESLKTTSDKTVSFTDHESPLDATREGSSPRENPSFRKSPLFWTALISMTLIGGCNPIVAKLGVLEYSYGCSPNESCELELYDGFMAISYLKYFWQTIIAAFIYKILDFKILPKPFFSARDDYLGSKKLPWKVILIFYGTSLLDTGFTICERAATVYTRASVVSALSSTQIIVAVMSDLLIVRRALMTGEIIGLVILQAGIIAYAFGTLTDGSGSEQATAPVLGFCLALASCICRGIHASVQGKYMCRYKIPPLKTLCIESGFGQINLIILMIAFTLTGFTDFVHEFWMCVRNWKVMLSVQLFGFLCIGFNGSSCILGKFISGLFRMILIRFGAMTTWILELSIGWTAFEPLNLFGWIIMLTGTAIFAGTVPRIRHQRWFWHPFLCGQMFDPPAKAILTPKQQKQRNIGFFTPSICSAEHICSVEQRA